jgi:NRPS condensation-like uncharacterized protein
MKRRLFFLERVLYGDGKDPFNGVLALKLRGQIEGIQLRQALNRIQQRHTLLRCRIEPDEQGIPCFVEDMAAPVIPVRVVERVSDGDWLHESLYEWRTIQEVPLLRVVWLRGGEVSDLILSFHHCMCDGGSALSLMRDLLQLLDAPGSDLGELTGLIAMESLLPLLRGRIERRARGIAALIKLGLSAGALLTSSKGREKILRHQDYLIHWKLEADLSLDIFRYCKARKVTVNTFLCVAFLYAFWQVRGEQSFGKVTCPVDIRRYHPGIKKDMLFAFGLAVTLSLPVKKRGISFEAFLSMAQEMLARRLGKLNVMEFLLTMENCQTSIAAMIKVLTYGKPGNDLMFSNLGRLDGEIPANYTSFEVETVYSPTVIGPFGNPTTLVTTTYKGKLDLSFVSNRMVLEEREGQAIKEKFMELLEAKVAEAAAC